MPSLFDFDRIQTQWAAMKLLYFYFSVKFPKLAWVFLFSKDFFEGLTGSWSAF